MWTGYFYADTFKAYRASQRSFAQMSMYAGGGTRARRGHGAFRRVRERRDGSRLAELLRHGRRASVGGTVLQRLRRRASSVISEAYRRRIFGNASGIGEAIKVDAVPATVIGVAADGFERSSIRRHVSTSSCPSR